MEQNTQKFRLKLNLFDGIVLVLAVAVAAFLLWRAMKPAVQVPMDPSVTSTVRYTVRFQRWTPGTSALIQAGDRIADTQNRRYVWAEMDGFEDVLVTIEAPCTVSDAAITVGGGYELRVGSTGYFRGEGYMGSGPIVAIEEVQG